MFQHMAFSFQAFISNNKLNFYFSFSRDFVNIIHTFACEFISFYFSEVVSDGQLYGKCTMIILLTLSPHYFMIYCARNNFSRELDKAAFPSSTQISYYPLTHVFLKKIS